MDRRTDSFLVARGLRACIAEVRKNTENNPNNCLTLAIAIVLQATTGFSQKRCEIKLLQ